MAAAERPIGRETLLHRLLGDVTPPLLVDLIDRTVEQVLAQVKAQRAQFINEGAQRSRLGREWLFALDRLDVRLQHLRNPERPVVTPHVEEPCRTTD